MSFFYAIDGDDIGRRIEQLVLTGQLPELVAFSLKVASCLDEIKCFIEGHGGSVILCAGDSLFAESESPIKLCNKSLSFDGVTFSAGIGQTPEIAFLALKKAKGLGKKRIEFLGDPI